MCVMQKTPYGKGLTTNESVSKTQAKPIPKTHATHAKPTPKLQTKTVLKTKEKKEPQKKPTLFKKPMRNPIGNPCNPHNHYSTHANSSISLGGNFAQIYSQTRLTSFDTLSFR